jgi:8-oxo-dGTP diphosphatase
MSGYKKLEENCPSFFTKHDFSGMIKLPKEELITKIKELKYEVVKAQQYELASYLREFEKDAIYTRAAIALVLHPTEYKILGVSRKDDHTQMGLPGGKVELTETFEEAVVRETKEETGLDIEIKHEIFEKLDTDFIGRTFWCTLKDPDAKISTDEAGRVDWITWEELFAGPFGEYNRQLFDHINTHGTL